VEAEATRRWPTITTQKGQLKQMQWKAMSWYCWTTRRDDPAAAVAAGDGWPSCETERCSGQKLRQEPQSVRS
jgi:hypothetical protein